MPVPIPERIPVAWSPKMLELMDRVADEYPVKFSMLENRLGKGNPQERREKMSIQNALGYIKRMNDLNNIKPRWLKALEKVRHHVCASPGIMQLPVRIIFAAIFQDLDIGLFNGILTGMTYIETDTDSSELSGATDPQGDRAPRVTIAFSKAGFDQEKRKLPVRQRMYELLLTAIHEMCHAYLFVMCGPGEGFYAVNRYRDLIASGHGIFFSQVMGTVQTILDSWIGILI
jgi:hypothetical protein